MARVLITGGSGFLGINLVRFLLEEGYTVSVLDIAPFTYPEKEQIHFVQGDVRNKEVVRQVMQGVDYVVHCAMALPLYEEHDIRTTGVNGTLHVLQAAKEVGVHRVVHISSSAVYGVPQHVPISEDDRLQGVGPYGEAKVEAEKICQRFREEGMCVPVLRPKTFVGKERLGVFAIYYEWIKEGRSIPLIGNGKNKYQLLDVEDLCKAIHLCLLKPKDVVNDVFNIGAKEYSTMKEDFGSLIRYQGSGKKIIGTPAWLIVPVLRFLDTLGVSPLYEWVYATAAKHSYLSIEKAERLLGFRPEYSNAQALLRSYRWYLEHYDEFAGEEGVDHRTPWKQGVLKVVKKLF